LSYRTAVEDMVTEVSAPALMTEAATEPETELTSNPESEETLPAVAQAEDVQTESYEAVEEVETEAEEQEAEDSVKPSDAESAKGQEESSEEEAPKEAEPVPVDCAVFVNGELIVMRGKAEYVFIDVFDYIDFDLSDSRGRAIVTQVNEKNAFYTQTLSEGDEVVIRWSEE
ncbi:MAG: hypothetical protein J6B28_09810, partial [Eubacterium sp.]|nr:hypothetical protein [Eubacterium sp.]